MVVSYRQQTDWLCCCFGGSPGSQEAVRMCEALFEWEGQIFVFEIAW
jgi:hypothetical protein